MTAEEVRIQIRNIEDRAYSMMYFNQKLRPARDCRRIGIARDNDIRRLIDKYAQQREQKTAVEFGNRIVDTYYCEYKTMIYTNEEVNDLYTQFKQQTVMKTPEEILSQLSDLHDIWSSKFGTDDDYEKLLELLTTWGKELCEKTRSIDIGYIMHLQEQEEIQERNIDWPEIIELIENGDLPDILKDK